MPLSSASTRTRSIARSATRVDRDGVDLVERVVALQPGELDDLLDQPVEPLALGPHPGREAVHGRGVVGGLVDRLGQQVERPDRGLQLVADVGDEVTPDRLDATFTSAILDQDEHELAAQWRHPRSDVPEHGRGRAAGSSLVLADLPVAAYLANELEQLGHLDARPRGPGPSRAQERSP